MSLHELWRDGIPGEQPAADLTELADPARACCATDERRASMLMAASGPRSRSSCARWAGER